MILKRLPSTPTWPAAFREFDAARRDMARLFDAFGDATQMPAGVFPPINVSQNATALFVRTEMPGIRPADLEITIENDTLTIAGERVAPADEKDVSYHRREREWGRFRRSFALPVRVDPNAVEARYRDGILTITLPKAEDVRPKQITVQAAS